MMGKYENKKIYGGKNYINAILALTHEERAKLEQIKQKEKYRTINIAIEKLLKKAISEAIL